MAVGSFEDTQLARLQAGQALQRVLLTATVSGLSASFLAQLAEVPAAYEELRRLVDGGWWPQSVLRMGYGSPPPGARRWVVHQLLADDEKLAGAKRS
jgi:hypothetical protein